MIEQQAFVFASPLLAAAVRCFYFDALVEVPQADALPCACVQRLPLEFG